MSDNRTDSALFSVEKFGGENFHAWSVRMRMALTGAGLWSIVSGVEKRPGVVDVGAEKRLGVAAAGVVDHRVADAEDHFVDAADSVEDAIAGIGRIGASVVVDDQKALDWDRRAHRALALIALALKDSVLIGLGIGNMTSPRDAWLALERVYGGTGLAGQVLIRQRLAQLRMGEGDDVVSFVNDLSALVDQLSLSGGIISEGEVVAKLLTSLPPSWNPIVSALSCVEPTRLTRQFVIQSLLHEQMLRRQQAAAQPTVVEGALVAARRGGTGGQYRGPRHPGGFDGECYECGQVGHRARDCPRRVGGGRPQRSQAPAAYVGGLSPSPSAAAASVHSAAFGVAPPPSASSGRGPARQQQQHGPTSTSSSVGVGAFLFAANADLSAATPYDWLVDSGASAHMCSDSALFVDYQQCTPTSVTIGDGTEIHAVGLGTVELWLLVDGVARRGLLSDVLHVPDLATNLFSVSRATQQGYVAHFTADGCRILSRDGVVAAVAQREGNMYKLLCCPSPPPAAAHIAAHQNNLELWHLRLGHVAHDSIRRLQDEQMVTGLESRREKQQHSERVSPCAACLQGKQHSAPISSDAHATRATQPLELVHTDVVGPMNTPSVDGYRYYIGFVDDFSRKTWSLPMKAKSDALAVFKVFRASVEKLTGFTIRSLRSDHGGEYLSAEFRAYLQQQGIAHQLSAPYTPEQNGVAERTNRTIVEMARTLIWHAQMPYKFWVDAVATATYIKNRCPHRAVDGRLTPEEAFTGKCPDVRHLRVFGCTAWVLVPDAQRTKLDAKSRPCVFVGYTNVPGVYRLWSPDTQRFITSRNVVFDEQHFHFASAAPVEQPDVELVGMPEVEMSQQLGPRSATADTAETASPADRSDDSGSDHTPAVIDDSMDAAAGALEDATVGAAADDNSEIEPPSAVLRRLPPRTRQKPCEWWKAPLPQHARVAALSNAVDAEPASIADAFSRDDAEQWRVALRRNSARFARTTSTMW